MDTDYWSVRFIFYTFYAGVMNALRFDSLDLCQLLIGEGLLVSQITTMLLFNELNLTCGLFCLVPWLLVQNAIMSLDIISFTNEKKNNFVRLVGPHQAIFMMLVNAVAIMVCAFIESITLGLENAALFCYIPFVLYLMNRMMEER